MNDIRFAVRQLFKNPVFTAVALLSLALGIGANTALYGVVYGVLISPYPYARPEKMWWPGLRGLNATEGLSIRSYRLNDFQELAKLPAFEDAMATSSGDEMLLAGEFSPESVRAVRLTSGGFHFLGVAPVIGRTLGPSDLRPDGEPEPVVVLSYRIWQRLFAGRPDALGKTVRLNDQPYTIVGVMPPRFGWYTGDGLWLLLGTDRRDSRMVNPLVRLKPGVTRLAAEQQLHTLHQELAKSNPGGFPREGFTTALTNYLDVTVASFEMRTSLRLLFGAVAFLLLIACANVANLQLARGASRAREMAIRLSIGASRARLTRQLLTESVVLSLAGGVLGLVVAVGATQLMVALMPTFYVPNEASIEVNGYVLCFCLIISLFTGILFGLAPALQLSRSDLTGPLKDGGRSAGASSEGGRTRAALVIVEVALAVVLLVSAGLTARSFAALHRVDLGFQPERVLLVDLPLGAKRFGTLERRNQFSRELLARVENLPGVVAASVGNGGLPFGGPSSGFSLEGQPAVENQRLTVNLISADFPRTLGIPLRRGRLLTRREIDAGEPLALINETAAKLWRNGEDPLGRRVRFDALKGIGNPNVFQPTNVEPVVTVVGVIGDTRNDGVRNDPQPVALVPYTLIAPPRRTLAVRALGDPKALFNSIRAVAREMDPELPLGQPGTIEDVLGTEMAQPRFVMALFGLFATLGLALAIAGIYSVLSFVVTKRTHEIGVRMALGAQRRDVLRLILRAGGGLVIPGLIIGVFTSLGAARLLRSQLFEITTVDPVSFVGVVALLSAVAVAACYIPARRATKVDPMVALRYE